MGEALRAPYLGAVMFTDVVGYTAMMQGDVDVARDVRERHRAVIEGPVAQHRGELIQYLGDGSLSAFPSAVEAIRAAVAIQLEALSEPVLPLRIGVHEGEITFDEQGPYGDSVNISSRIQALGTPGSILISGKVYDDIKNRRDFPTVDLGAFKLKNVQIPVEVHAVAVPGLVVPTGEEVSAACEVSGVLKAGANGEASAPVGKRQPTASRRARLVLTAALATAAMVAGFAFAWVLLRPEPPPVARFAVTPGEGATLLPNVAGIDIAISQDGSKVIYVGQAPGGEQLWERQLEALEATPIRGTANARDPVFSPDGGAFAFRVGSTLRTSGFGSSGLATPVAEGLAGGAAWGPDGMLYYPVDDGLFRVAARGGDPERVTRTADGRHRYPSVTPDGRHVLFTVERPGVEDQSRIAAVRLSDGEILDIGAGVMARYARSGHLLYGTSEGTIRAARFDLDRMRVEGPPVTVLTPADLRDGPTTKFAISDNGTLVYRTGLIDPVILQMAWVTRSGRASLVDPGWSFNPGLDNRGWDLSPDEMSLAVKAVTDLGEDIWIKPLPRGPAARFTFGDPEERMPRWSPDGRMVAFLSPNDDNFDVWERPSDGTGEERLLVDLEESVADVSWSPDGRGLLLRTAGEPGVIGGRDVYWAPLGDGGEAVPILNSPADESAPTLSPDGRWLAYNSDETGRREVYVRPFPNVGGGQFQVSRGGGRSPAWSSTGTELFFVSDATGERDARRMMVATIEPGPPFRIQEPQTLFQIDGNYYLANNSTSYRVSSDGQRFLMARFPGEGARIGLVFVQNFFQVLRERARG